MVPTIAMCIFMGVAPNVFLKPMAPAIERLIDRVHNNAAAPVITQGVQNR
jgi:NADH:ubiquinone oxidoreductase subunit 4 (subunit M)